MNGSAFLLVRPSERVARPAASPVQSPPPARPTRSGVIAVLAAAILIVSAIGAFAYAGFAGGRPTKAAVLVLPLLFLATGVIARRLATRQAEPGLVALLEAAFAFKMLLALPRFTGGVDSAVYNLVGRELARSFRSFDFAVDTGRSIPGTGSVRYFTGLVHVLTGSNYIATFLIFAFIGFWGQYLVARAICIGFPEVRAARVRALVLFWPSMVFWPNSIGKESLMVFGIGLCAYGVARYLAHHRGASIAFLGGLAIVTLIRPHVALLLVTASIVPFVARTAKANHGAGLLGKVVALSLLVVLGTVIAHQTEQRLNLEDLSGSSVAGQLDRTTLQTSQGGGQFSAARVHTPLDFPWAAVTVLFRPFPFEARGVQQLLSSAEGIALAVLVASSLPRIAAWLRRPRQGAFVMFSLTYLLVFVYLFSAMGNFGILVRQRTQVLPFVFVLVSLPAVARVRKRPGFAGEFPLASRPVR